MGALHEMFVELQDRNTVVIHTELKNKKDEAISERGAADLKGFAPLAYRHVFCCWLGWFSNGSLCAGASGALLVSSTVIWKACPVPRFFDTGDPFRFFFAACCTWGASRSSMGAAGRPAVAQIEMMDSTL